MNFSLLLACSYALDLIFGDPEGFPHPVRGIGKLINLGERILWRDESEYRQRLKGFILAVIVISSAAVFSSVFIIISEKANPILGNLAWVYIGYTVISIKDLGVKAKEISSSLREDSLSKARKNLSKIVGRDTDNLSREEIIKASIESIAENTNDGIIAPLFYLILGGPVLAIAYKAINTLDSMIGYKNERYINFGWASAKIDDFANYIPARISGCFISISSFILGRGFKKSFLTMAKQGRLHPSLNSGYPEAAMAGALRIKIGGLCSYQGKILNKPYIGEDETALNRNLIYEALNISFMSSLLTLAGGMVLRWLV